MQTLARFLETYSNKNTAGGYSAAVYIDIDFVYGRQRKGKRTTEAEEKKYE